MGSPFVPPGIEVKSHRQFPKAPVYCISFLSCLALEAEVQALIYRNFSQDGLVT